MKCTITLSKLQIYLHLSPQFNKIYKKVERCTCYLNLFYDAQKFKFGMCLLKMFYNSFIESFLICTMICLCVPFVFFAFTVVLTHCCTFMHFIIITKLPSGTLITALPYYFIYDLHINDLTSRVFSVAHLKMDASVKFPGDQSIGHNHHQPWDCKQHKQQENIPKRDTWETLNS